MQKKHLLFLLLMAMFAPLAMNGQSTHSWGSSSTNSGKDNNANPFGRYYGYEYRVYLYPPNTMPFAGNITQLEFLPNGTLAAGGQIDVWMKTTTTITSLDISNTFASYKSGATQVYTSSSSPAFTQDTYVAIPLSTPIAYNYANNEYLMILVRSVANSGSGDGGRSFYYYNPSGASNNTWWAKKDSSDPGESASPSDFSAKGTGAYLPVVRFTYTGSAVPTISLSPSSATVLTGFTTTLTATCGNVTNPTITYSSSDTRVATVSGSGATATVTGVAPGTATITATMNGSYTATCAITVEDPHICTPTFTSSTTTYYISNFTTTGATTNINNTTSGTGASYSDYYNSYSASAYEGQTINFTITIAGGSTHGSAIWVDWNDDLEFSDAERVHQTSGYSSSPHSGSFTVPTGATLGDHRMRVVSDYYSGSPSNPCSASTGEFEDYKLTVIAVPSCMPITGLALSTDGATMTATWDANANATSYNVSVNGTVYPNATTTNSYTWNVNLSTTYTVMVEANCSGGETSGYCDPESMTTPDCIGGHVINYTLTDGYNDGWEGSAITIVDGCGNTIQTLTVASGASPLTGTLTLCGSYYEFVYTQGNYPSEYGWTFSEGGTTLFTGTGNASSGGQVLYTIGTLVLAPTNLTAGTPGTNSVVLNWTAGGSETSWQICINGDESNLITANTNVDYLLSNLDLDTDYTVKVRAINGNNQSCWSNTVSFTTEASSCPKPTNLTVSNLAASHATVSWDSEAGNYTVKYSTATVSGTTLDPVFEDGFESGLGNWTTYANGFSGEGTTNWQTFDGSQFDDQTNHGGSYSAMSRSWTSSTGDADVDNWLVSPQMTLGNTLKFWVTTNSGYPGSYAVYVSTGSGVVPSSGTGDFEVVANLTLATGSWVEQTYDLSAYAGQQGYVAIRHKDNAQDYFLVDDFGVYNTINTYSYGSWTTVNPNPTTESCQLTGLSAETLYAVQVQANCGGTDGSSAWSSAMFTTPDNCGAPQELASSDITATTATLSWADDKDSYNLQYRKVYFHEGFESETMPTGWTTIDNNNDGLCWHIGSSTAHSGANGVCNTSFVYDSEFSLSTTPDDYLISPQLDLQGTLRVWLSGYPRSSSNYSEHFEILLSTTGTSVSDFTTTLVTESTTTNSYVEYTADLSSYTGKGYIAIHHFNCTNQNYLYVDDFGIYGSENWVTLSPNPTTETANLTGLSMNTTYEWQVQGNNCDGNGGTTEWSDLATFSTPEGYVKHITGYGDDETVKTGWYLIASPIGQVDPMAVTRLINTAGYDLYRFDQNPGADENDEVLEWRNYKPVNNGAGQFNLEPGKGYLYANKEDVQLVFTGTAYTGTGVVDLTYSEGNDLSGWNLVGNPFAERAYIISGADSYLVLDNGTELATADRDDDYVDAMEGIFVYTEAAGTLQFSTTAPNKLSKRLALTVSRGRGVMDRAVVRFDNSNPLPKLQLRDNSTKIYFPMNGKDYAVVNAQEQGEMPVNFKAEEEGTYTLSINTEEVEFAYLHLIDNKTGNDIDLLETPSYTFEAKTTDYKSRFTLVFVTGSSTSSDTFAFFSNGSFVINNEGNATLQVIDVNGRIITSESINGCANVNVNAASGVYMLRLLNGDIEKTQKVVVR